MRALLSLLVFVSLAAHADYNVTIGSGASSNGAWSGASPDVWTPSGGGAAVSASEVQTRLAAGTSVTIVTSNGGSENGDITVAAPINWSPNSVLRLQALRDVNINANLTATGNTAGLVLGYGTGRDYMLATGVKVTLSGSAPMLRIGVAGGEDLVVVINSVGVDGDTSATTLQGIRNNVSGMFAVGRDIDAGGTLGWDGGKGFKPVDGFSGSFHGLGNGIDGLLINRPSDIPCYTYAQYWIGMFASTGSTSVIRDISITNANVTGSPTNSCHLLNTTGGLVGGNAGTIKNAAVAGAVNGVFSGGVVGYNYGSGNIRNSRAGVTVIGGGNGGLVGINQAGATITSSQANGNVTGDGGGLVGLNDGGIIRDSYATGAVVSGTFAGGLVGDNRGLIENCYATGAVSGVGWVGGLVGSQYASTVVNSYYDWEVTTINAKHLLTQYGIYHTQYQQWQDSGRTPFNIANYAATLPYQSSGGYYQITSTQSLKDLLAFNTSGMKLRFTSDIDLASAPGLYLPTFGGSEVDGASHVVRNLNLSENVTLASQGFIGETGATIKNIGILNVQVAGQPAGGLVGHQMVGTITNTFVTGAVAGPGYVGGLVGYNDSASISDSYAAVSVSGGYGGGLVGYHEYGGIVDHSYANGPVVNGYGLVGENWGTINASSYWDTETSGQASGGGIFDGGTGKLTSEMRQLATFAGWDISNQGGSTSVWRIYQGQTYPLLRAFLTPATATANNAGKAYDGTAYSGGNGVTCSTGSCAAAGYLGTVSYAGTSQGAVNVGSYAITPTGLYSNQTGYDISIVDGTLVISGAAPVNGACGGANGVAASSPPTGNLCSIGTASGVTGTGPWSWTCAGLNGGNPASCSAPVAARPTITSGTPLGGAVGAGYNFTVSATGTGPITFGATGLPPGLTIDPVSGVISGTPTAAGSYSVTLTATNASGPSSVGFTMVIAAAVNAQGIPTLSEWALLLTSFLMAGTAALGLQRRG